MTCLRRTPLGLCLILLLVVVLDACADDAAIQRARKLWLRGKYAEAADIYRPLAEKSPPAAVGLARCLASQGKLDEADKALKAAGQRDPDALAERASLAFDAGRPDDARKLADAAIALNRDQLLARWTLAELDRTSGRLDEADRGYRWFVDYYNDHDDMSAEALRWVALGAAQWARWNRQSDQFQFLIRELYPDSLKQDADFWPVRCDAGMLFLEKHNRANATTEFRAALEINPNAVEAHLGLAMALVEERQIDKAKDSLRRALEINPRLVDAWLLEADLLWANFQTAETLAILERKALPLNPTYESTLGRIAACYLALDKPSKDSRFARLVEQVTRHNPHAGDFYYALAAQLEERSKHSDAETYFREAIRVMPRQIGPEANLGLLYMRVGQEDEARRTLRQAFKADPFNVRIKNSLEVLDVLASMQTIEGDRFVVRYNGQYDKLLARYAARHVERILPVLCQRFGYNPPRKTLIEVFNRSDGLGGHELFSARMVGLPYVGTIAASTGRIVAMASPNDPDARKHVNWAGVLTHELVHVVTLQQTDFNCPHWFTEGLAVWSEGHGQPDNWQQLLRDRVAKKDLFNLDTLNFGFARPKSGDDWQMAYFQSLLYVEYMFEVDPKCKKDDSQTDRQSPQRREQVMRDMLAAYTEGLSTPQAIQRVFGMPQTDFERGYTAFLTRRAQKPADQTVANLREAAKKRPDDVPAATALAKADPDDASVRKRLAQLALKANDYQTAEEWANEAINIDVADADLHRLVAEAAAKRHNYQIAIEELETAVDLKADDRQLRYPLAEAFLANRQTDKARNVLEQLLKRWPDDARAKLMLDTIKKTP